MLITAPGWPLQPEPAEAVLAVLPSQQRHFVHTEHRLDLSRKHVWLGKSCSSAPATRKAWREKKAGERKRVCWVYSGTSTRQTDFA